MLKVPINVENNSSKKPEHKTRVVRIIALPVTTKECFKASLTDLPFMSSNLNLPKRCMVSSTAIPKAMVKMMEVLVLTSIPK